MQAIIRKDEQAVSPVIATILMVAITVVLAAVLYVMVSGLLVGPTGGPQAMGITRQLSPNGANWTLLITSTPTGLSTSGTMLTIVSPGGATVLAATAFSALVYATNGAVFQSDGDSTVEAAESLLINASTYPTTYSVRIVGPSGVLYAATLS